MSFCGAGHLADTHFFGTIGRAGGAEVHEIDAGDQEDEHGDDGEDVYKLDIAVGFELIRLIGIEVHVREGKDWVSEMITRFPEVGDRNMEHFLEGRANMVVDDFVYILLNLGSRGAGLNKDIGIIITT